MERAVSTLSTTMRTLVPSGKEAEVDVVIVVVVLVLVLTIVDVTLE